MIRVHTTRMTGVLLGLGLLISTSCGQSSFSGDANKRKNVQSPAGGSGTIPGNGGGGNVILGPDGKPIPGSGIPGTGNPNTLNNSAINGGGSNGSGSGAGVGGNGGSTGSNGGLGTDGGTTGVVSVPLSIYYNSNDGTNVYTGPLAFSARRAGIETPLVQFNGGAKSAKVDVPNFCQCGQKNEVELAIKVNGMQSTFASLKNITMASHAKPTDASDWEDYLDDIKVPAGPQTVFFGGFDHIFLFGPKCNIAGFEFACDDPKWNNRDDTKVVFMCQISKCANGGAGTELRFTGM
jgi:hypothetical protein